MSSNSGVISAYISIFDDLTFFMMSFEKIKSQKIFWTGNKGIMLWSQYRA